MATTRRIGMRGVTQMPRGAYRRPLWTDARACAPAV